MKRFPKGLGLPVAALAIAAALSSPLPALAATDAAQTDGIIVTYASPGTGDLAPQSDTDLDDALADAGLTVTAQVAQADGQTTVAAQPAAGQSVDEAVEDALGVEGVVAAQPNYLYELVDDVDEDASAGDGAALLPSSSGTSGLRLQAAASFDDPIAQVSSSGSSPNQYWLYTSSFTDAWSERETNHDVTVAVLDGPIDVTHEDLAANVLAGQAYDATSTTPGVIDMTTVSPSYDSAHATHVAGIIAGVANNGLGIAGASYNANILPVMVVGEDAGGNTVGSTATVLAGLDYVRQMAATDNIRVVSISLRLTANPSSATDTAMHTAIADLRNEYDIVTVCAGGNYNAANASRHAITDPSYPADYDECVSVTAVDAEDHNWSDSEYNQYKDISAPGVSIWSTWYSASGSYGSAGPYVTKTGTSMAAPIVSAAFALLFAERPSATVDEACQALYLTANPITYTSSARDQARQRLSGTHGVLDAAAALDYLTSDHRSFPDVKEGDWFYESVQYATLHGIMNGYGDGSFGPDDGLAREQAAGVMYNYLGDGAIASPCAQTDVAQGEWYANAVNWAVDNGVMSGYGDGTTFGVGDTLTREQIACVLANAAHADTSSESTTLLDSMPDALSVDSWARGGVAWALNHGVISGVEQDGARFVSPQGTVTRAQMAAIMMNAIQAGLL